MHWFDIGITIALLLSGLWSFFRGLIRELFSMAGLVVASVLAIRGYPAMATLLEPVVHTAAIRQALGFAVIFMAVMAVAIGCGFVLRVMLKTVGLSLLDRFLGGGFGLVKVVLIASVALILITKFAPPLSEQLAKDSVYAPYLFQSAAWLAALVEKHDDVVQQLYKQVPLP